MKKYLFYVAASLLFGAASCSDDQSPELEPGTDSTQGLIGFKSFVEKSTKGISIPSGQLQQDFWVYGYYDQIGDHSTTGLQPSLMYNQRVIYSGNGFTYTPIKYWPETGDVEFYAYTPNTPANINFTNPATQTSAGYPVFSYTVSDVISNQEDLLTAGIEDLDGTSGTVNLAFSHALTKIGFSARTAGDYASQGVIIKIDSIKLDNILKSGSFSYDKYMNNSDTTTWWTTSAGIHTYRPGIANSGGLAIGYYPNNTYLQVNANDQFLLLMPQNVQSGNASITIYYHLDYADSTPDQTFTKVIQLNQTTAKWKASTYINYALTISLNSITFSATVGDWTKLNENIIILPSDDE